MTDEKAKGHDSPDRLSLGIEITSEMIEAGVLELRERFIGESLAEIVTDVFIAMMAARNDKTAI